MTRKYGSKKSLGQKSMIEYNRRRVLVKTGKAMWVHYYSAGVDAAIEKAGL